MLDFIFGTKEPLCKAADVLCNTLEGYGYEVHSPDALIDVTQGISDITGLPVNASLFTLVTAGVAAVYGISSAARAIMNRSVEKENTKVEIIIPVTNETTTAVTLVLKPSHEALVDKYTNLANKDAVKKMATGVLAVFNTLSEAQVIAFGQKGGQEMLRFNKMKPEAQIEVLQALEGAGAKLKMQ